MKIKLRDNPKYPFFYTVDRVIGVTRTKPEQLIDDAALTPFHHKVIEVGVKKGIIDVVDAKASPSADPSAGAAPYSLNTLRKAIGKNEISVEKAQELIKIESEAREPRKSLIRELEYLIKRLQS